MDTNEKAIEMHKKWNGKLETIHTWCCGTLPYHRRK